MADARRGKQKRKPNGKDEFEKRTKEEIAVAKYLRFHPSLNKEGKFVGNNVQYFTGARAVDLLLESKWSSKNAKTNALFSSRSSCTNYCQRLLEKAFFHRVLRPEKRDKKKRLAGKDGEKVTPKEEVPKKEKKSKKEEVLPLEQDKEKDVVEHEKDKEVKPAEEKSEKPKDESEEKKRRKKKLKLEMHDKQIFVDGPEHLYVWIYDPVPVKAFVIGLFLVLGAIAVCLFPLWPPEVRLGVYYLSLAAVGFVGVIVALCIIRYILVSFVWVLTFGKVTFWLFPNLTEDVGFLDSFRPVYNCTVKDKTQKDDATSKKNDESVTPLAEETGDSKCEFDGEKTEQLAADEDNKQEEDENDDDLENEEEDEDAGHSGSSNDNGYEIVNPDDVEDIGQETEDQTPPAADIEQQKKPVARHRKGNVRKE